jgi:hypothetical protein
MQQVPEIEVLDQLSISADETTVTSSLDLEDARPVGQESDERQWLWVRRVRRA